MMKERNKKNLHEKEIERENIELGKNSNDESKEYKNEL